VSASVYWRRRCVALLIGLSVLTVTVWLLTGTVGGSRPVGGPAAATSAGASLGVNGGAGSAASQSPAGRTAPVNYGLRPCPAGAVVLSLFDSQAIYTRRQTPEFEVDVVSTASRSCSFNIGARYLVLAITAGSKDIWTSADCAEGQASLVTTLRRGVPTVVPITWNGQHSGPGCPVPGAPAAAGTYTATASDGGHGSNSLSFGIR